MGDDRAARPRDADPAGIMPDPAGLLTVARLAAQAGADVARTWRERAGELRIEQKRGPSDLVSQADREAEGAIRAVLARCRPHDRVLGEEQGETSGGSGVRWIVDLIDGTTSYLYGRADWAVSVGSCIGALRKPRPGYASPR